MTDIKEIRENIKEFILSTSYVPVDQLNYDTLIFDQGLMDSMGFISIIGYIEEVFSVEADDSDLVESNFESIDAIANFVFFKLQTTEVL